MTRKPKLELTWIGKDERPKLEPRILIEEPELSHHAATHRDGAIYDNMLIQGDNLLALKALEADYAGKVKCVFIDPPYNTGSAFEHYDDGLEHSLWLTMMRDRLEIIRRLLSEDGSLWITIDDNEAHYLKVLCDEVFGRGNFIANVIWQKAYAPRSNATHFSDSHDHLLVYAKFKSALSLGLIGRSEEQTAKYKNPDNDPRGPWKPENSSISLLSGQRGKQYAKTGVSENVFEIVSPTGVRHMPPANRCWVFSRAKYESMISDGLIWFGVDGNSRPAVKKFLSDVAKGVIPQTIWEHEEVGHNQESSREVRALFPVNPFATPKPERLLSRILSLSTNPGDLVLDSFAGSGTTGAVAHKMGRRWIMVELGEHAKTHIVPRLKKVIDGADPGGVTETVGWKGGGGYRFFRLAPSLLSEDKYGNWVISKDYNPAMLAEALCKHMGYTYAPSQNADEYWKHGQSTETDFIYVTTQQLTQDACRKISDDVGPDRTLLICCKAFSANPDSFDNLTLVKIPTAILKKCEWGRDDYSLQIKDLPPAVDEPEPTPAKARSSRNNATPSLFDDEEGQA